MRFFLRYIFKYNVFAYICFLVALAINILMFVAKVPYIFYLIISPATIFGIYQFIRMIFSFNRKYRFYKLAKKMQDDGKEFPLEWRNDPCYMIILDDVKKDYNIK